MHRHIALTLKPGDKVRTTVSAHMSALVPIDYKTTLTVVGTKKEAGQLYVTVVEVPEAINSRYLIKTYVYQSN